MKNTLFLIQYREKIRFEMYPAEKLLLHGHEVVRPHVGQVPLEVAALQPLLERQPASDVERLRQLLGLCQVGRWDGKRGCRAYGAPCCRRGASSDPSTPRPRAPGWRWAPGSSCGWQSRAATPCGTRAPPASRAESPPDPRTAKSAARHSRWLI